MENIKNTVTIEDVKANMQDVFVTTLKPFDKPVTFVEVRIKMNLQFVKLQFMQIQQIIMKRLVKIFVLKELKTRFGFFLDMLFKRN